jgi:Organic solute transporter Ostalpha
VDVKVGIPSVLLCVEMGLFSILHIFAFPWKPYDISKSDNPNDYYSGGPLGIKALLDAFNPMDFVRAAARGFRWLFVGRRHRELDESYDAHKRTPGTLSSGQKISGPYPLSPSDTAVDDEDFAHHKNSAYAGAGSPEVIELMGPGTKRAPTDEFSDRTGLLAQPQGMPVSAGTLPEARPLYSTAGGPDRSNTSTPPAYLSPGLHPSDVPGRMDEPSALVEGRAVGARRDGRSPPRQAQSSPGRSNRREEPPGYHGYGQAF